MSLSLCQSFYHHMADVRPEGEEERYAAMNVALLEARNRAFALRRQPANTRKTYDPKQQEFTVCVALYSDLFLTNSS